MRWLCCLVLWLVVMTGAALAEADTRLDEALSLADSGDYVGARHLAEAALQGARTPEARFDAGETLLLIAHWQGKDAEAMALAVPLLADGAEEFGADSPRLVTALRVMGFSQGNLGDDAAALQTGIRAVRLARGDVDSEALQVTLGDLGRVALDLGLNEAAALIGAEAEIQGAVDGGQNAMAEEDQLIRALAHLRMGHPVEAVAQAMAVTDLAPTDVTEDAADLMDLFEEELTDLAAQQGTTTAVIAGWTRQARSAGSVAEMEALTEAMIPLMQALQAGDGLMADEVGRRVLQRVRADDPVAINAYFGLLAATLSAGRPDLAAAWAGRLAEVPPEYLATLPTDPAGPLREVANWLMDKGRAEEAVGLGQAMVAGARLRGDAEGLPWALTVLGEAERRAMQWQAAARDLGEAVTLGGEHPSGRQAKVKVQALVQLGLLSEDQGQTAAAERAYTGAMAILQATDAGADADGWAYVLGQLGALYVSAGRLDEAEVLLQKSLSLATQRDGEAGRNVALALYELARFQVYAGRLAAAEATSARALQVAQASLAADDPQLAAVYLMRAAVLERLGQADAARAAMAQAVGLGGDAALVMQQAVLDANAGDYATARRLMAGALHDTQPEDPIYARLQAAAGAMALKDGDLTAALDLFRGATQRLTMADRRDEPDARDHLPLHVATARRLAEVATGSAADNLMAEAFAVAQRVNDLSAGQALTKAAARLQGGSAELSDLARDVEMQARAVAEARARLLAAVAGGASGVAERADFAAAEAGYDTAAAAVAAQFPRYASFADPKPQDLVATMQMLGPDEVLVLFATSDMTGFGAADSSSVIALTREGYVSAGLPPRAEVEALARAFRCSAALTDRHCGVAGGKTRGAFSLDAAAEGPVFDLDLAQRAYDMLLGPIDAAFAGKTTLIVVPDKALAAVPFHLMLTAPAGDASLRDAPWLIRKMAVMVVPTVTSLASLRGPDARPSQARKPFLGIGDPVLGAGDVSVDCAAPELMVAALTPPDVPVLRDGAAVDLSNLPPLPETRCELQAIARQLGTPKALLLGGQATETAVKRLSGQGDLLDYRVISFATHGLIAGEIGRNNAGLVLTPPAVPEAGDDGLLTTAEIANLRLDADFVLLSACNTAAGATGRDEGLSGLASAFFLAGARSLLVSHWPVYSDAATRLTTATFDALAADPGIGRAEALRRAMLGVLDDPAATPEMLHPAWWGPFMVAGEGGRGR